MVRTVVLLASTTAILSYAIPSEGATPVCAFDDATGVVTIHLPVQDDPSVPVVLSRAGVAVIVDGAPCGDATVTTAESIVVDGEPQAVDVGHAFEIDLSGGPFAPGRTDEGDGTSEIGMTVDTGPSAGDQVTIVGGEGAETILLDGREMNLDGAVDDVPDVLLLHLNDAYYDESSSVSEDHLALRLGAGDDEAAVTGRNADTPVYIEVRAGEGDDRVGAQVGRVWGGAGDDRLVATRMFAYYSGGAGDDVLRTTGQAHANFSGGRGRDLLVGGEVGDYLTGGMGDDVVRGRAGDDGLFGSSGDDRLWGGADRDHVRGEDGDDLLRGGPGFDYLYGGRGRDRCDAAHDLFVSGCAGPPLELAR
jgi:Ca2+-binding RTX toxin-like protein